MSDPAPDPAQDEPENWDDATLAELRLRNLGRLLDEVHVGFDRLALSYLHEAGYPGMSAAHTHVLRTMQVEGESLTAMSERAGISKQAMSKLVGYFESQGFLEWRPVEGTGTKLVHATAEGRKLLAVGLGALKRAEEDYFTGLSAEERETLRDLLARALRKTDRPAEQSGVWRRRRA